MSEAQRKRGFAAMDPERQRELARLGGHTAQREGRAPRFTHDEAVAAAAKSVAVRLAKKQEAAKALIQQGTP